MYFELVLGNDILGILAFFTTAITSATLLSYLNNVSLAKKCLLLYLYKDFLIVLISLRLVWVIKVILSYLDVNTENHVTEKVVVFCLFSGILALQLIMNGISALKMIIAKRKELDPSLPWIGDNESSGINKIRIICSLFVFGIMSILYGLGLYPKMYYGFAGIEEEYNPVAIIVYRGILGVLLITCLSTWIRTKHLERATGDQMDTLIPRTINYFLWISFTTVGFMLLWETLEIFDFKTRWNLYQLLTTAEEMIISIAIILKSEKLKAHFKKSLKNKFDEFFLWNIILVPTFLCCFMYGSLFVTYHFTDI